MKVVLELQDQPSNVRRITIRHDIVIGRGSDCNLRLSAPQVSRRHCFLRVGRDSVSVTDLDSSNGTFVDGRRLNAGKRCDIADGAQLALGPILFIVHVHAEAMVADSVRRKSTAGVTNEFPSADSEHHSAQPDELHDDSVTKDGRTDSNPLDSRLEIVDFGRLLSEEILNEDETRAVSRRKATGQPENVDDREPQWTSRIIDSPEFQDDIDVLSIADESLDRAQATFEGNEEFRWFSDEDADDDEIDPNRQNFRKGV